MPVASIIRPRRMRAAFNGLIRIAKTPSARLITPQMIPRMAALRIFLRAQTTRRAWFSLWAKEGSVCMDESLSRGYAPGDGRRGQVGAVISDQSSVIGDR